MKRAAVGFVMAIALTLATPAFAASGVEHLKFAAGPYHIRPGANLILVDSNKVPKPDVNGFMTRMAPNLRYALPNGKCCGTVPRVDVIHLHHGVWLSDGTAGQGEGNSESIFYPFMASGEEKTAYQFPHGFGYPIGARDGWILNYMIHNLTAKGTRVFITYDMDFIPDSSPAAAHITPVHPIWMDVEDHHVYPVFDVHRHSGVNGKFTFPDMARNPYLSPDQPLNEFTVDHPGTLVATAGHLHPGGLYDDLDLIRAGAKPSRGAIPGTVPNSVRLFRSNADYFDKRGPISWDMAMTATPADWRPAIKAGDTLRISTTYETKRASWYEAMGIMVAWEAWDGQHGVDPFTHKLDETGHVTHGHLPENNNHGGSFSLGVNLKQFPTCFRKKVQISDFHYDPGDFTSSGSQRCTPTIRKGQSLTFVNNDASPLSTGAPLSLGSVLTPTAAYLGSIFHSVTACAYPCGLNTGISYPLADGPGGYDSGQLGIGTPAVGKLDWSTSTNLKPGTYTFFCRIHPFMRGVFRIIG